jgi:Tfp pilus assembly PilM family ATPase
MASASQRQANPIGIDLTGQGLRALQVETVADMPRLVDMTEDLSLVESEDQLRSRVAKIVRDRSFVGTRIATSIPSESVAIHHVRLPALKESAVEAALRAEIAPRLGYEADQAVVRYIAVTQAGGRNNHADYVVFSTPRHIVEQHLRMAEKLGLTLVGISALPLAIGHAFSYLGQRRDEAGFTFLVAHLEPKVTHLVIMHQGELRFARTIHQGVHDVIEAAAASAGREASALKDDQEFRMKRLDEHLLLNSRLTEAPESPHQGAPVPYEKAGVVLENYAEEITSCLCYFASTISSKGVDKLIFTGPQANDYDFCQVLASRIKLPAQIGDPLAGIRQPQLENPGASMGPPVRRPRPEMSVAVGLSLFGSLLN